MDPMSGHALHRSQSHKTGIKSEGVKLGVPRLQEGDCRQENLRIGPIDSRLAVVTSQTRKMVSRVSLDSNNAEKPGNNGETGREEVGNNLETGAEERRNKPATMRVDATCN